jgi:23S rRNA (cytidine1920-2'-O)/16S rRNA (cytidine1409-2'-O)-methyltransferase
MVDPAESLVVSGEPARFVGRGGEKLLGALQEFGLDPNGLRVLDAGASTGGFTDCLLQHGADHVVALDVGHGQLHERIRRHPAVTVLERTNLRHVTPDDLEPFDAAVADLSFISLTTVMEVLISLCLPGGWLVLLVKPQFEAGRQEASRGRGVITDPAQWDAALRRVVESAEVRGARLEGVAPSPLKGAEGNVEFLVHLGRVNSALGTDGPAPDRSDRSLICEAVERAAGAGLRPDAPGDLSEEPA